MNMIKKIEKLTLVLCFITLSVAGCVAPDTGTVSQDIVTTCGIPPVRCYPTGGVFTSGISVNGGLSNPDVWCSRACTGSDIGSAYCPQYTWGEYSYCNSHPNEIRDSQWWCYQGIPNMPHSCLSGDDP
jgi:hypothetical protein